MRSLFTTTRERPLLTATREKPAQQQRPSTVENKLKRKRNHLQPFAYFLSSLLAYKPQAWDNMYCSLLFPQLSQDGAQHLRKTGTNCTVLLLSFNISVPQIPQFLKWNPFTMQEQLSSHRTSIPSNMFWKTLVYRLQPSRDGSGLVSCHSRSTLSCLLFLLFPLCSPSSIWPVCIHPPRLHTTKALTKSDWKHLPSCLASPFRLSAPQRQGHIILILSSSPGTMPAMCYTT